MCLTIWLAVPILCGQDEPGVSEGVRMPVDYFEDGRVKTEIWAEKATFPAGGVEATGVKVSLFEEGSEAVAVSLLAETCTYQREAGRAVSDSRVYMTKGGVTITGKGFEWDMATESVTILSDVRVVLGGKEGKGWKALNLPGFRKE